MRERNALSFEERLTLSSTLFLAVFAAVRIWDGVTRVDHVKLLAQTLDKRRSGRRGRSLLSYWLSKHSPLTQARPELALQLHAGLLEINWLTISFSITLLSVFAQDTQYNHEVVNRYAHETSTCMTFYQVGLVLIVVSRITLSRFLK